MSNSAFKYAAATCVISLTGLGHASLAATTIEFVLEQPGRPDVAQAAYIDQGKALIRAAGGDPDIDLLFRQTDQTMIVIDHRERSTLDLDAEKVSTLAGQASDMLGAVRQQVMTQLENLPEAQREQLKGIIEGLGGGQLTQAPPPPAAKTLKPTGLLNVNGFTCSNTEVYEGDALISEVCTAAADDLGIPAEDFAVIESMQAMSRMLRDETARISSRMGQEIPQFGDADVSGVPVVMKDRAGNAMTVTAIRQGIGGVPLSPPAGYAAKQMPSLPQLIQ